MFDTISDDLLLDFPGQITTSDKIVTNRRGLRKTMYVVRFDERTMFDVKIERVDIDLVYCDRDTRNLVLDGFVWNGPKKHHERFSLAGYAIDGLQGRVNRLFVSRAYAQSYATVLSMLGLCREVFDKTILR